MAPTCRGNKKAVIDLVPPKEDKNDKPIYIKHTWTVTDPQGMSESVEERIPKIGDESTPQQLLCFLTTIHQAKSTLSWNTGDKLFQKFCAHLSCIQLDNWTDATARLNQTVPNFDAALVTFKNSTLSGYTY